MLASWRVLDGVSFPIQNSDGNMAAIPKDHAIMRTKGKPGIGINSLIKPILKLAQAFLSGIGALGHMKPQTRINHEDRSVHNYLFVRVKNRGDRRNRTDAYEVKAFGPKNLAGLNPQSLEYLCKDIKTRQVVRSP